MKHPLMLHKSRSSFPSDGVSLATRSSTWNGNGSLLEHFATLEDVGLVLVEVGDFVKKCNWSDEGGTNY